MKSKSGNVVSRGFSLLEILVVISIIGLLAGTMVFSYSQFVKQSQDARRKTDIENIRIAIEQYRADLNTYPGSIDFSSSNTGITNGTNIYMKKVPNDPKSTNTYWYSGNASSYSLCACLAGGGTAVSSTNCGACPSATTCNYCIGPYGQL